MLSAASSMWSQTSSITDASRYMSSRSNGVTKVRLSRLITSCVSRSPSCSSSRMSRQLLAALRPALEQLDERSRDLAGVRGRLREEVEEAALLRGQPEGHRAVLPEAFTRSSNDQLTRNQIEQARPALDAVDRERRQRLGLEESHQEPDREVGGHGRARARPRAPGPRTPLPSGPRNSGSFRMAAARDDRRREQEREPGGVLVREPDEQAAAHRRAGAREARDRARAPARRRRRTRLAR